METSMRKTRPFITFTCLLLCVSSAFKHPAPPENGAVVEQTPCAPNAATYEQFIEAFKRRQIVDVEAATRDGVTIEPDSRLVSRLPSKDEYERRRAYAGFECQRIKYLSDGLKVVGYIWRPRNTIGKKLPLIIYNRGGNREFSKLTPWMQYGFYDFVSSGFVVIGSQYRGNDGGEGREEFGGADVHDVLNLIPLAKSLGYVDMSNIFLFGHSRGGMMTYLALKNNIAVNAAATTGGLANMVAGIDNRPLLIERVYRQLIPDFDTRREELIRARSAVYFADKINTPLLILQGNADWRSNTSDHALALVQKLQEFGKTYELIVYSGDDHALSLNRADRDKRIVDWFRKHMK